MERIKLCDLRCDRHDFSSHAPLGTVDEIEPSSLAPTSVSSPKTKLTRMSSFREVADLCPYGTCNTSIRRFKMPTPINVQTTRKKCGTSFVCNNEFDKICRTNKGNESKSESFGQHHCHQATQCFSNTTSAKRQIIINLKYSSHNSLTSDHRGRHIDSVRECNDIDVALP